MKSLNNKITDKLLCYFYRWELKGNKIKYTNYLDPKLVFYGNLAKLKPDTLVLLDKEGVCLDKNQCKAISKSLIFENWILTKIPYDLYLKFHNLSHARSIYDYLFSQNPLSLMKQIEQEDLKYKISNLLKEYKEFIKAKPTVVKFFFISKQKNSIPFLNSLCEKYILKKEGYVYTIKLPKTNFKQTIAELNQLLANYKQDNPETAYKIHERI